MLRAVGTRVENAKIYLVACSLVLHSSFTDDVKAK